MIHIFLGTKAQLVKMAPIMVELKSRGIPYNFIHSGQHQETMSNLLADFGLAEPDHVLHEGQDITSIPAMATWLARILWRYGRGSPVWQGDHSGIVLVHGDTFSTLAGALLAKRAGLKVGHVEAGLRSFRLFDPFPEELTRLAVFRLADYLFCPGGWACGNLTGLRGRKIDTGGNTLIDSIRHFTESEQRQDHIPPVPYAVASIHRFENIFRRSRLEWVCDELIRLAGNRRMLFILHPPTRKKLLENGLMEKLERHGIELRPRYGYLDFISLIARADFLITDGGSNQEEASYLGLPCLIMRGSTERQEGVGSNAALSSFSKYTNDRFLAHLQDYRKAPLTEAIFPSRAIVDALVQFHDTEKAPTR